ncbi:MAG: FkbM family methyltransferase [Rhodomicrobium sp.]|nr:FkbM family methyltransferase [Rhodomicrobium sp.]
MIFVPESIVSVYDVALSNTEGAIEMVLREDFCAGAETGNASIAISEEADGSFNRIKVRCIPFDAARREFGIEPISVLKVDIEGQEDQFLLGSQQLLNDDRPVIFTEVNPWFFEKRGLDVEDAFVSALPIDYRRYRLSDIISGLFLPLKTFSETKGIANIILGDIPFDKPADSPN